MVVCGDRRRVEHISRFLDNVTLLTSRVKDVGGDISRVEIAVGTYKGTPIAAIETQMGCPATEIIMRELTSDLASTVAFDCGKGLSFRPPRRYIIRLGSAAGINGTKAGQVAVNAFDVVIATHSVGCSGADIQALTGRLNFFDPGLTHAASEVFKQAGYSVKADKHGHPWYLLPVSDDIRRAMAQASNQVPRPEDNKELRVHELGNFSKDSLYAEAHETAFTDLRDSFDVGTSEMELATITRVAAQARKHNQPISVGQLSVVLGTIPGASFFHDKPKESASIKFAVQLVLETLHQISLEHRSNQSAKL